MWVAVAPTSEEDNTLARELGSYLNFISGDIIYFSVQTKFKGDKPWFLLKTPAASPDFYISEQQYTLQLNYFIPEKGNTSNVNFFF